MGLFEFKVKVYGLSGVGRRSKLMKSKVGLLIELVKGLKSGNLKSKGLALDQELVPLLTGNLEFLLGETDFLKEEFLMLVEVTSFLKKEPLKLSILSTLPLPNWPYSLMFPLTILTPDHPLLLVMGLP